jgi:hypothetical protein
MLAGCRSRRRPARTFTLGLFAQLDESFLAHGRDQTLPFHLFALRQTLC